MAFVLISSEVCVTMQIMSLTRKWGRKNTRCFNRKKESVVAPSRRLLSKNSHSYLDRSSTKSLNTVQRLAVRQSPKWFLHQLNNPLLHHSTSCTQNGDSSQYLTRFNNIVIEGTPQTAADKEAISLSRVKSYHSKCNPPLRDICLFCSWTY